jgi:hypothetical protein
VKEIEFLSNAEVADMNGFYTSRMSPLKLSPACVTTVPTPHPVSTQKSKLYQPAVWFTGMNGAAWVETKKFGFNVVSVEKYEQYHHTEQPKTTSLATVLAARAQAAAHTSGKAGASNIQTDTSWLD